MFFRWLAPILWMTLIFLASTGAGSAKNTSRIIGPLLRWLLGSINDETVWTIQFYIRKCGHAVGYAILAILCWRALAARPLRYSPETWKPRTAFIAWLIASLYAISDEIHQATIPSRQGAALDVLLDSVGAFLGLMLIRAICHYRSSKPKVGSNLEL